MSANRFPSNCRIQAILTFALIPAAMLLMPGAANADDMKTPLGCKLDAASGGTETVSVTNTTKLVLKTDTLINVDVMTMKPGMPGTVSVCFPVKSTLKPGAQASDAVPVDAGAAAKSCSAFLSTAHPAIVRNSDGSSETDCDPH